MNVWFQVTKRNPPMKMRKELAKENVKSMRSMGYSVILGIFQLTCFGLAGYMVYVQLKTYFANQDLSTVTYENFQNGAEDVFPTFTICAVGGLWILKDNKLPKGHTTREYAEVLSGQLHDQKNYSSIKFDHVIINVNKLVSDFCTTTDTGAKIIRTKLSVCGRKNSNSSLRINHLDSEKICVTKEDFQTTTLVEMDLIGLTMLEHPEGYRLKNAMLDIDFYIHQKGQLLRSLKRPSYHLDRRRITDLLKTKKEKGITKAMKKETAINVVSVDVLRKRMDSINPCDPQLQDEDNQIRHSIMNVVGCIPAFNRFFLNESLLLNKSSMYPACNRSEYKRIYQLHRNVLQAKDLYTQPCTRMNNIVTTTDSITNTERLFSDLVFTQSGLKIEFNLNYLSQSYREIVNTLGFDMATLWSQVGGFIGMFLGYSLLQVPELAKKCVRRIKSFL